MTYHNGIVHSHRKTVKVFFDNYSCSMCAPPVTRHTSIRYSSSCHTHTSTWVHRYSSLLQWSVPLGQRGHVTMVGRILCTKCTLHCNHRLTVWYSDTQNDFFPWAAILSLHTLASPSGRNVNYDEKQLAGKEKFWVVPSICTGFVNTFPTVFL